MTDSGLTDGLFYTMIGELELSHPSIPDTFNAELITFTSSLPDFKSDNVYRQIQVSTKFYISDQIRDGHNLLGSRFLIRTRHAASPPSAAR